MEEQFRVKTLVFEGPLDLLLSLIEKRKLFINDISLAQVADDYINHVKNIGKLPMEATAHFILIASTLLLIKSKSLLPTLNLTEEERGSIEDLELRLELYKFFKNISVPLEKQYGKKIIFYRPLLKSISPVFTATGEINTITILNMAKELVKNLPQEEALPKAILDKVISLEEMIVKLSERVSHDLKLSFRDFTRTQSRALRNGSNDVVPKEDKKSIIISFLALLELVKQGVLRATQENWTGDINIETKDVALPNYNQF
jgi:segregation and condensation protein A